MRPNHRALTRQRAPCLPVFRASCAASSAAARCGGQPLRRGATHKTAGSWQVRRAPG
ncbi:hypothetical protein PF008_g21026 [Phytophthora fragariae]|uniref:Uncharacterized protein n=1 Tax=Phytophthora fragariae TaxID=53985 RepID=A0A6G0QXR9_9STRA|nr:hypothetical protein PF008_g21026 [Phytophthora fragariae]